MGKIVLNLYEMQKIVLVCSLLSLYVACSPLERKRPDVSDHTCLSGAIIRGDTTKKNLALVCTGDEYTDGGIHILAVLESTGGARKQTSEILGINASTLYRKLKKYGVQDADDPDEAADDGSEGREVPGDALIDAVETVIRESSDGRAEAEADIEDPAPA